MLYYNLKVCCFFNFKIDACFFGWNLEGFFWKTELAWKCPVICATFSGKSSPLSLKVRQMSQVFGVTLWSDISESYSKSSVLTSSFPSTSLFLLQFWHLHRSVYCFNTCIGMDLRTHKLSLINAERLSVIIGTSELSTFSQPWLTDNSNS